MSIGQQIFDLIRSMNTSEKGYFKKYTKLHKQNSNLVLLFQFLSKEKSYSEERINQQFERKSLKVIKQALLDTILKSMRSYRYKNNLKTTLNGMLSDIHFLYEKKQITLCQKWIKKGRKLSEDNELPYYLMLFYQWEIMLLIISLGVQNEDPFIAYEKSCKKVLHQVEESITLNMFQQRINIMGMLSEQGDVELYKKKAEELLSNTLLQDENKLHSVVARLSFHGTFAVFYIKFAQDWAKAYQHFKASEELLNQSKNANNFLIQNHFTTLFNILVITEKLKYYDDFEFYLNKVHLFDKKYSKNNRGAIIKQRRIVNIQGQTLLYYSNTNQFEKAKNLMAQLEYDFESSKIIEAKFMIQLIGFLIVKIHFLSKNYDLALEWLEKLSYWKESKCIFILSYHFRILELLVYFEMDNRQHLPTLIRSFTRFIKNKNRDFAYEKHLLNFLKTYQKLYAKKDKIALFKTLHQQLLLDKNTVTIQLPYFDILEWSKQ